MTTTSSPSNDCNSLLYTLLFLSLKLQRGFNSFPPSHKFESWSIPIHFSFSMVSVALFVPNIIGYVRAITGIAAFYFAELNPRCML